MTINKRYIEMERFLQFWVDVCRQNPGYEISSNNVYDRLIKLGVPEKDSYYDSSYNGNFEYWVTNFSHKKNTNVFVDNNWSYFCQFINDRTVGQSLYHDPEHIKMYIPLDGEHIKKGVQMIFEFLSKKDIKHLSKVGKEIRFDGIVVRLSSSKDAQELQKFIDNNQYIQKGLLLPNPFAFSKNNIAYACDGKISYNATISNIIALYFKERKDKLGMIRLQDFIDFTYKYYQDVFITRKDESRFVKDFDLSHKDKRFGDLNLCIQNYKQVFELFLKTIHPDFQFEHLVNQFLSNGNERNELSRKIAEMETTRLTEDEIYEIVFNAYQVMSTKYGYEMAKKNIIGHIETGNLNYLTRTNQIRESFLNLNIREYLLKKAQREKITILEEVDDILLKSYRHSYGAL